MTCRNCERAEMVETQENYHYRECGLDNVTIVGITVRKCPECGNLMPMIRSIGEGDRERRLRPEGGQPHGQDRGDPADAGAATGFHRGQGTGDRRGSGGAEVQLEVR